MSKPPYMSRGWWAEIHADRSFGEDDTRRGVRGEGGVSGGRREGASPIASNAVAWREFWQSVRQTGIKRRREWVEQELKREPVLPDWLRLMVDTNDPRAGFTRKQHEALILRFGHDLSLQEAADAAGITKSAMRHRLEQARKKVEDWYGFPASWRSEWEPFDDGARGRDDTAADHRQ